MDALNAVVLTPISVLSERKEEPRKFFSLPTNSPLKSSLSSNFPANPPNLFSSRSFHGGLVLLSSVLKSGFAKALTYEELLQQSTTSEGSSSGIDISGVFDSVINFGMENPAVVVGGAALLAVPLILSQVLGKPKPWGVESAKSAFAKLGYDASAQLLDIRASAEIRQVGSPDIRGLKKKPISLVYKREDKPGFLKKLALKFKKPENTTLFVLDKFNGNSKLVAELVTSNGFKAAYAIKDGAEGNRGWMNSGLPWILPNKTFNFDLSNLTETIDGTLGEGSEFVPIAIGITAVTGLGLFAFSEVQVILELLGSAALVQLISKKFLFAEDRKQTLQQVDKFLTTKVAPLELVDEIKQIGKALLPSSVTSKALPAPANASQAEALPESNSAPSKVEAHADPTPRVNSIPNTEVKAESLPGLPQPLSPYPAYSDFRPPTSPTPSKP